VDEVEIKNPNENWVASENVYPMMLYRAGNQMQWDGRGTDTLVVKDVKEHSTALGAGWLEGSDYGSAADTPETEKTLLDKTAKDIELELGAMTLDDLETLKAEETDGKARKGVLAMIDTAIDEKIAA
jgi:hypothetical protein